MKPNHCNKIPYSSRTETLADIRIMEAAYKHFNKRPHKNKSNRKMSAYECQKCGMWHTTTRANLVNKRMRGSS